MSDTINFAMGRDYLQHWGIQEALREVFQNYKDYGNYGVETEVIGDMVDVTIVNTYKPDNLEFLRIGNSTKHGDNAIGKYGEGLKMAMLIFARLGYRFSITTNNTFISPHFVKYEHIGEVLTANIKRYHYNDGFIVEFKIPITDYNTFVNSMIIDNDVIHTADGIGTIVNRKPGSVYSGGFYVAHVADMEHAYDIQPKHIHLNRDRNIPDMFYVRYYASKIIDTYTNGSGELNVTALDKVDYQHISSIPESIIDNTKPELAGDVITFVHTDDAGKSTLIKNSDVIDNLKNDSRFDGAINKLKNYIARKLGLYDLLIAYSKKHVHGADAKRDFELILNRVKK